MIDSVCLVAVWMDSEHQQTAIRVRLGATNNWQGCGTVTRLQLGNKCYQVRVLGSAGQATTLSLLHASGSFVLWYIGHTPSTTHGAAHLIASSCLVRYILLHLGDSCDCQFVAREGHTQHRRFTVLLLQNRLIICKANAVDWFKVNEQFQGSPIYLAGGLPTKTSLMSTVASASQA